MCRLVAEREGMEQAHVLKLNQVIVDKAEGVVPALQSKLQSLEKITAHLSEQLKQAPSHEVVREFQEQLRPVTHTLT